MSVSDLLPFRFIVFPSFLDYAFPAVGQLGRQITIEHDSVLVYVSSMQSPVDLKQMTLPAKLQLMEALWDELCSREEEIPVPDWHKAILDEREQRIKEGKATFIDWETAKQRIGKRIS